MSSFWFPTRSHFFFIVSISLPLSVTHIICVSISSSYLQFLSVCTSPAYSVRHLLSAFFLPFALCVQNKFYWLLVLYLAIYRRPRLIHLALSPSLASRRIHIPMPTSCLRRLSSWPKRESVTQRRSTRPPTSSKTESKTLFAVWSSAKSYWTCLSPSTHTSKR